ncbi:hypothetical protein LWI29_030822 [Acer saccharum]|uniref:SWIM-type domain-containing protein n=1 Tax=Acer saccharum TaxID=4024 RepID=A0AA39VC61_ACESA|nr:hypothetical protein LWI29_030822 [Acer saccharum]
MPQLAQCPQELGNVLSSSESYAGNPPPLQASTEIVEILNDSNAEFVDQPIPEDSEDEDYMPYTSKIAKSIDISDNSCHDNATFVNKGNGNATPGSSDNSDDDHPSNAASFDYDLNNMVDSSSDEEEGNNIPHINRMDKPYKVVEGGRVVLEVPLKHWTLHAFEDYVKSDHVTNNINECFNVWIEKFRAQPALSILEGVRKKMMQRMTKRLEEGRNWVSNIPPLVNKKPSERQDDSRFVSVLCASDKEFEVKDGVTFYIMNLDSKRCDCGLWELSGIPCKYALAVLTGTRQ